MISDLLFCPQLPDDIRCFRKIRKLLKNSHQQHYIMLSDFTGENMQLRKHAGVFTNREVAEKIGIYPEALSRLKRMGIVPQPTRNVVGLTRRYYSEQDVEQIVEMLKKDRE